MSTIDFIAFPAIMLAGVAFGLVLFKLFYPKDEEI